MGDLMRRFWQPALLASELPAPDCPPVRVRLLGEDLVAFRDSDGRVGLLAEHCAHRGASLYFGRVEAGGLRCVYHGWKWDADGACLEMPNEPATSTFKDRVRQPAYATREKAGLIWAYLGPPGTAGDLPGMEWLGLPPDHLHVSKWILEANYLQGMEGEVDSAHISFLHTNYDLDSVGMGEDFGRVSNWRNDLAPALTVNETDYGFVYGSRRNYQDGRRYHWRLTHWLLPTYSLIPGTRWPIGGRCWVPIDDEHTWTFNYWYNADAPIPESDLAWIESGIQVPPVLIPGTFKPVRNKENDYQIDREAQRTRSYTGIYGGGTQDRAIVESMGPIYDRTKEHLVSTDVAVIAARRILLRAARDLQEGRAPGAAAGGSMYRARPVDVISEHAQLGAVLREHADEIQARTERSYLSLVAR
jgi:phenylpropionate dioxygenase-like ring-hydroxylating dioxygenase large terminal subunit